MLRISLLLMCIPGMALAETGAGETLPSTADLFSWSYLGQVIASLALVIGLLFGALWIMRRVNGVGQAVGGQMRVVSSLGLGQRERAVLVSVGEQQILLGVAPGRVGSEPGDCVAVNNDLRCRQTKQPVRSLSLLDFMRFAACIANRE